MIDKIIHDRKVQIMLVFIAVSLLLISTRGISTGLDLQGGSLIQIQAERVLTDKEMDQVKTILEDRMNRFGVKDVKINKWGNQDFLVYIAGVDVREAQKIIGKPGKLTVRIGNLTVFTGGELKRVDPFSYEARSSAWAVPFTISDEAAERFRDAAVQTNFSLVYMYMDEGTVILIKSDREIPDLKKNLQDSLGLKANVNSTATLLETETVVKIDKTLEEIEPINDIIELINASGNVSTILFERSGLVNSAPISLGLQEELKAGQIVKSMLLETGGGDAGREKARYIEIVLRSGALPIKVDIMGSYGVPAALGEKFKQDAIFAGMLASLGVILIIFIRYRKPKLVAPVVFTGFSEVVIILGMASLIKWDIDLPAIAGIIAVIGTGMDNQIVILDEIIMEREKSIRYKIKNAFFIVIGSWLTLMAAMIPLFFIGFRMLQGFAVTTIIGATMGVFVTRPAYARIVQYLEVKR